MTRAEFRRAYTPKPVVSEPRTYMVCAWRGDGRYQHAEPVALYKSEKVAQKAADRLNAAEGFARQLVVRFASLSTVEG